MKFLIRTKVLIAALSVITLNSCTYRHEIGISVRDGRVVFEPYRPRLFGPKEVARVENLRVERISREAGAAWEIDSVDGNGRHIERIVYGVRPEGFGQTEGPAPLRIGQLYQVQLIAPSGHGSKYFVISPYGNHGGPDVTVLTATAPESHDR